jgi:hypothetical protein
MDETPAPAFQNQQLNRERRQIRLLQTTAAIDGTSINCQTRVFDLSEAPAFTALSYCWGASTPNHAIDLNGFTVTIRANLYDFLLRWANDSHNDELEHASGYLWVDQLCIDQRNHGERSYQVAFMGEIYSTADRTIVWLGKEDIYLAEDDAGTHSSATNLAFNGKICSPAVQARLTTVTTDPDWEKCADDRLSKAFRRMAARQLKTTAFSICERWYRHIMKDVDWWICLLGHEYWTRLWIVQEICLSSGIILWIGAQLMTWNFFCLGSSALIDFDQLHGRLAKEPHRFIYWLIETAMVAESRYVTCWILGTRSGPDGHLHEQAEI